MNNDGINHDYFHIHYLRHFGRRYNLFRMAIPGRRVADMETDVENNVETLDDAKSCAGAQETIDYESLYREAAQSIAELTAERDSLITENKDLRAAKEAAIADGAKAREMNYTLSRQLNIGQQAEKQPEDYLAEMFLKKGDKES